MGYKRRLDQPLISGIYEFENLVNGHRYIGSSSDIFGRYNRHLADLSNGDHHCQYLQAAWNKYGAHNFRFNVLMEAGGNRTEFEQNLLDTLHPKGILYNVCLNACGPMWENPSPEKRARMSRAQKESPLARANVQRLIESSRGRPCPAHVKERLRKFHTARVKSESERRNISEALKGRRPPDQCLEAAALVSSKPVSLVKDVETRDFRNLGEAADFLGVARSTIARAAEAARPLRSGWRVTFLPKPSEPQPLASSADEEIPT